MAHTGCRPSLPLCFLRRSEAWVLSSEGKDKRVHCLPPSNVKVRHRPLLGCLRVNSRCHSAREKEKRHACSSGWMAASEFTGSAWVTRNRSDDTRREERTEYSCLFFFFFFYYSVVTPLRKQDCDAHSFMIVCPPANRVFGERISFLQFDFVNKSLSARVYATDNDC